MVDGLYSEPTDFNNIKKAILFDELDTQTERISTEFDSITNFNYNFNLCHRGAWIRQPRSQGKRPGKRF